MNTSEALEEDSDSGQPLFLKIYIVGFESWMSIIAIIGNLLILWKVPKESVKVAKSVKIYYLVIAVGDMLVTIV